jgi:hypothetical protein
VPLRFGAQVLEHSIGLIATLATTDEVAMTWSQPTG